jgi:hypothetical protein
MLRVAANFPSGAQSCHYKKEAGEIAGFFVS